MKILSEIDPWQTKSFKFWKSSGTVSRLNDGAPHHMITDHIFKMILPAMDFRTRISPHEMLEVISRAQTSAMATPDQVT